MKNKTRLKNGLRLVIYGLMALQIAMSFYLMVKSLNYIPSFGDTIEYLELSQSLAPDEYRPILYPLFLRLMTGITEAHYHTLTYIIQTVAALLAFFYALHVLNRRWEKPFGEGELWFFSLFGISIPIVTFMNMSVLTDSFALSALLVMGALLIECLVGDPGRFYWRWILVGLLYMVQALLRQDRLYSILIFVLLLVVGQLVRGIVRMKHHATAEVSVCQPGDFPEDRVSEPAMSDRREKDTVITGDVPTHCSGIRKWLLTLVIPVLIMLLAFGTVRFIGSKTQEPGRHGRITTNASLVLLDRIVWPHLAEHYEAMPEDIKHTISYEEAVTFDEHNNNVMYQLAAIMYERVGKEQAEEMFTDMARVVWQRDKGCVIKDIVRDIAGFVFMPQRYGARVLGITTDKPRFGWNAQCFYDSSRRGVIWTERYFSVVFALILFPLAALVCLFSKMGRRRLFVLKPFLLITVLIGLWFAVGDGAPPNERYEMIGYATGCFIMLAGLKELKSPDIVPCGYCECPF
ncbi:MAG: hypothetical protein Q4B73_09075 [Lachnospiraceae bacterium]|nr:hypothetical protein [Lachnospiraceae bacterium]